MVADERLKSARDDALVENTAQAVYKDLTKLSREETRFRSRWVWELLQNARDASPEEGVCVWLIHEAQRVIFKHSGVPFSDKNIAHLIYHGSTKEEGDMGEFGSGFLTTHLISKTVSVKGRLEDGRRFDFMLDRHGSDADELKVAMDKSWDAFIHSLREGTTEDHNEITTEFSYPLIGDSVGTFIAEGLVDLITNATYLLAFNEKIKVLHLEQPDRSVTIARKTSASVAKSAQRFHIEERVSEKNPVSRYVAVIADKESSAAVEITELDNNWSIAERDQTPRIFKAFPLTGTRDFCLPVVINNEKFRPREERDTLVLLQSTEGNPDMLRMDGACELAARLAILAAEKGWLGAAKLLRLNPMREWNWVDPDWFRNLVVVHFIELVRTSNVMMTVGGERIAPTAAAIPLSSAPEGCRSLWDVGEKVKSLADRLPQRDEAHIWADNLTSWAPFLAKAVEQLTESLTLEKLCEQVSKWGAMTEVKAQLSEAADPIKWLNELHALISTSGDIGLFERLRLLPNQKGVLKKITELRQDPCIDEELKDIAESFGLQVRNDLVDQRLRLKELLDLPPKSEAEVVTATIQKLKEKANSKSLEPNFGKIAVQLFVWLVRNGETDKLDGFPVLTRAATADDPALIYLSRDPAKFDERPLAPIECWPEQVRMVADLFPKRQTIADALRGALPEDTHWLNLADKGYLRLNPLYETSRHGIPFIPDEPLPVSDKDKKLKHRTKGTVKVSALSFFEKDGMGLDAVRRSKTRAVSLLLFLANYVLEVEPGLLDAVEADCECGLRHRYYPTAWLVPMWDRRWVPLGDDKQSSASAETIAQLFEGREGELRQLAAGNGRKLLEALGISLADLSLRAVAKDENTRISLIDSLGYIVQAADNDPEKVRLVAEEIKHSPELIEKIREHRETREKIHRNQRLGAEVERLLKEALEEHGLKVTRTGVGSDYEVEEDYVVDGREIMFAVENERRSFLVEIKATVGKVVRMTVTQAETAVRNKDRFILCIVRLDSPDVTAETVRERCRFVVDIAHQVEPVWNEYHIYQQTKGAACTRVGEVELIVGEGEVRFAVGTGAWASGLLLPTAVHHIVAACRDAVTL